MLPEEAVDLVGRVAPVVQITDLKLRFRMEYREDRKPVGRLPFHRIGLYHRGIGMFLHEPHIILYRPQRHSFVVEGDFLLGIVVFVLVLVCLLSSEMDDKRLCVSVVYPPSERQRRHHLQYFAALPCRLDAMALLGNKIIKLVVDFEEVRQRDSGSRIGSVLSDRCAPDCAVIMVDVLDKHAFMPHLACVAY